MASILTFLHGFTRRNAITAVVRQARRPGIGLVLVVLFSMVFAQWSAEAQTDDGESTSNDAVLRSRSRRRTRRRRRARR